MDAFTTLNGLACDRANVDTDQIIPKQYLNQIKRTGLAISSMAFSGSGTMGDTPNERRQSQFSLNLPNSGCRF